MTVRLGDASDRKLLDPVELASRDEITALQTRRLAATLHTAYAHVPATRAKFDASGVHPDDFRQLADLAKFPFTTKADLRASYPFGLFAVPQTKIARPRLVEHNRQANRRGLYAGHPLPHAGSHPPAAGHCAHDAADAGDNRTQR